ncbi:transcriptional regulator, rpir family [Secundilactobacillus collinoides DSM 20515 = JCM 1123]|uniref:Transcriptional regulator, rpir family n=3 Tax=Secundilactobacillus collinoides TaxID=33960 RepID=A0A0R2BIA9_SECCO|nr:transcriptional regulator, rpir family [Secundilactobacillus collinoides DSM 20515 = JCM 1123]
MEAELAHLSRQERKIAMKVIQNPKQIQTMGIADLAKAVGVSSATVTRFVRRVGCADFSSFKVELALQIGEKHDMAQGSPTLNSVSEIYLHVLQSTWNQLNPKQLDEIVALIKKARRIYIYGLGSSGYSAQEMTQRLIRMGLAAFYTVDSHMMFINASVMSDLDLMIVLSSSGETKDVNDAVELAKKRGVTVVGLTGVADSTLTKLADVSILVKNSSVISDTRFVNSQFAAMFVLDNITTMLLKDDKYSQKMNETIQLIMERKYNQ